MRSKQSKRVPDPYDFMALLGGSVSDLCKSYVTGAISEDTMKSVINITCASFTAQASDPAVRLESVDLIGDELIENGFTPQEIATIRDNLLATQGVVH